MENHNTFDILFFIARPAAGKSEIIHYLKQTPLASRIERFHIGEFQVIDDFPMIWTWFEEDDILSKMGYPRLHTDKEKYFIGDHLWNLLVRRICLEYNKKLHDNPKLHSTQSIILEFSRGKEHGGYTKAFEHLSDEVVKRLAILYVNVPWEESLRKNRSRYNPQRPDSILEHGLPDDKMFRLYRDCDWATISAPDPEFVTVQGTNVPYAVFENEDDVTTKAGEALGQRLESVLGHLWQLYHASKRP
ncbi:MAG: hypothetical protein AB1345_09100 [Chloroflexota bacterium]